MSRKRNTTLLWAIVPIIIGAISFFVLSDYFTSQDFTGSYIEAIDAECDNAIKLSAGATGLATAITFIPSDYGESLSDQLAIIGVCFVAVISLLTLEKYLLTVSAFIAFKILIPFACIAICIAIALEEKCGFKQACKTIGYKIIAFALILFLLVPLTVGVTNIIKETHNESIEASMQKTEQALEKVNGSTSGKITDLSSLTDAVKERITGAVSLVKEAVTDCLESLAVMIVTSCLLPIAVMVGLILLGKLFLGINLNVHPTGEKTMLPIMRRAAGTGRDFSEIEEIVENR